MRMQNNLIQSFRFGIYIKLNFFCIVAILKEFVPLFCKRIFSFEEKRQIRWYHCDYIFNTKLIEQFVEEQTMILFGLNTCKQQLLSWVSIFRLILIAEIHLLENEAIWNVKTSSLIVGVVIDKIRSVFLIFDVVSQVNFYGICFFFLIDFSEFFLQLSRHKSDFILIVLGLRGELILVFRVEFTQKILSRFVGFEIKHSFFELLSFCFELLVVSLDQFNPLRFVISISHSLQFYFLLVDVGEPEGIFRVAEWQKGSIFQTRFNEHYQILIYYNFNVICQTISKNHIFTGQCIFVANQIIYPRCIQIALLQKYHQKMSKQNDAFDDDFDDDDFGEDDQINNNDLSATNRQNTPHHLNFAKDFQSNQMAFDDMGSFGPGMGRMGATMGSSLGGMHGLGGFGMGMGGGFGGLGSFGGGPSRFGGGMFGDYGSFGHSQGNGFSARGLFNLDQKQKKQEQQKQKSEEKKQPKQPEETEEEKLARLTKKKDIPEHQQITLVDWAIRGPAEIIRMVLEYILIPYKERKYVFVTKDKWFKEDRPRLQQMHPGIQLPYLQDGSNIIYGTQAILTYILHKYQRTELLGITPDEKVRIATVSSIFWQFMEDYYELVYGEYDESLNWQKARERYINQKFKVSFFRMINYLKQTNQMSTSSEFSWVDLAIADMVSVLNQMDKSFKQHSNFVQNYANRVFALPQFIVYRRSDRFHERPYNGLGSIWK